MNGNQQGDVALITGANSGIGLALTRKWLSEGGQVAALIRSDFPAEDAEIREVVKSGRLRIYKAADLADYDSLRRALEEIKGREPQIDVLFNNAGGSFPELGYSKQGRERHYELMTVVPYIILMEMKGLLTSGRLKTVINTSSSAFNYTKRFSVENLEHPKTFRKLTGPYASAKLALSLWTQAVAPRLAQDGIRVRSVDPGGNNTLRKDKVSGLPLVVKWMMKLLFSPPTKGANLLYQGAVGEHRDETGVFLVKDQVTALKFSNQAGPVLERVRSIYESEYAGDQREIAMT